MQNGITDAAVQGEYDKNLVDKAYEMMDGKSDDKEPFASC